MIENSKIPPQAVHIEQAVLGAIMLEKDAIIEVIDLLKPSVFYKPEHQKIYEAVLTLFNESKPIDLLTITDQLRKTENLELCGGAFYLSELTSQVTNASNITYHSRMIYEKYLLRELIRISSETQQEAFEDGSDPFDIIDKNENDVINLTNSISGSQTKHIKTVLKDTFIELDEVIKNRQSGQTRGVKTCYIDLDNFLHGLFKKDLTIIAARPGMGKTTFALNLARNIAVITQTPTAFFSLEMSEKMLMNKIISTESSVDFNKIISGNISDYEMERILKYTNELSKAPLFIDDTHGLSTMELRAKVKRLKYKHDIQVVFVDYLQLMTLSGDKSNRVIQSRENEVSAITRQLKGIAKELDISVVVLCQLNREADKRANKRPQLADLRESGSIEQDADRVLMIFRQDYYHDNEADYSDNKTEIIIAKNRHGATGTVNMIFKGEISKFESYFTDNPVKQIDF
jgi:replicative DNA helicase